MRRVTAIKAAGQWNAEAAVDLIVLDAGDRHRRRIVLTGDGGTACLLDLDRPATLRDGDGLVLDDGSIMRVAGLAEPLVEISTKTPGEFVRLAWHLGNRHTDVQLVGSRSASAATTCWRTWRRVSAPCWRRSTRRSTRKAAAPVMSDGPMPDRAALYRLMAWLSPAYPVGAFSYSSGIEWAVEAGDIKNAETLRRWLGVVIGEGAGLCDAMFFVHSHRSLADPDDRALVAVAELAAAFAPSKERHLETTAQGAAFIAATRAAWPCAALDRLVAAWTGPVAYPVAVAVAAAGHGIAVEPALHAFLHAVTVNLISAGVRLIPLGQTDGQRVLAALEPVVATTAERAMKTPLDDIGSAAFRADMASQLHETQYTRLFRS